MYDALDLSTLRRALIGIAPLPFVIVENIETGAPITYFRHPSGAWSWQHPTESKGRTCLAPAGSRFANDLDLLLVELPTVSPLDS